MPVTGLDHVNIRTTDIAATARFYADILDLEFRHGPEVMGQRGNWLFDQSGNAVIHLREMPAETRSTGPIDHVAFACQGKAAVIARLTERGIDHAVYDGIVPGVAQIFLHDPHGVALELNFNGEGAA